MYGGTRTPVRGASLHKFYFKKFRHGGFPNRTRKHWNVAMTGITRQRPRRMAWPYDICSLIFNRPQDGTDKIGYVVGTSMAKTAVVAASHLVYYPKFNQRVSRTSRFFAHDEDMACVDGDLVHIRMCRKISRYKHYYIFSILEPNIEARERLKIGLRAVPPPLFGYPVARRIVKLNLTKPSSTAQKAASVVQEHVQEFYRFSGKVGDARINRAGDNSDMSFDDVSALVAPNAPPTLGGDDDEQQELLSASSEPKEKLLRSNESLWMKEQGRDLAPFAKSP